ncbi:MAG: hypothetical protein ABR585_09305 [Gemmatimonadaceae bacterium]
MDRINRLVAEVYGYAVCLITVIVMLVSIKGVIDAAFDLSDPIRAEGGYGRLGPLTSFELYKLQARREGPSRYPQQMSVAAVAPPGTRGDSTLSDAELRKLYDAERESQIGSVKFRAMRTLVSGFLFIVLAGVLFAIHWRWLRRLTSTPGTA